MALELPKIDKKKLNSYSKSWLIMMSILMSHMKSSILVKNVFYENFEDFRICTLHTLCTFHAFDTLHTFAPSHLSCPLYHCTLCAFAPFVQFAPSHPLCPLHLSCPSHLVPFMPFVPLHPSCPLYPLYFAPFVPSCPMSHQVKLSLFEYKLNDELGSFIAQEHHEQLAVQKIELSPILAACYLDEGLKIC